MPADVTVPDPRVDGPRHRPLVQARFGRHRMRGWRDPADLPCLGFEPVPPGGGSRGRA